MSLGMRLRRGMEKASVRRFMISELTNTSSSVSPLVSMSNVAIMPLALSQLALYTRVECSLFISTENISDSDLNPEHRNQKWARIKNLDMECEQYVPWPQLSRERWGQGTRPDRSVNAKIWNLDLERKLLHPWNLECEVLKLTTPFNLWPLILLMQFWPPNLKTCWEDRSSWRTSTVTYLLLVAPCGGEIFRHVTVDLVVLAGTRTRCGT